MAFSLDQSKLLVQLRTAYLLGENSEYSSKILKIPHDDTLRIDTLSESPPITFEIARHLKKSIQNNNNYHSDKLNNKKSRIRSKSSSKRIKNVTTKEEREIDTVDLKKTIETDLSPIIEPNHLGQTPSNDDNSISTQKSNSNFGLKYTRTIKNGNKKEKNRSKSKIPIVKFFQGKEKKRNTDSDSDSDSDIDVRRNIYSVGSTNEDDVSSDVDTTENDLKKKKHQEDHDDNGDTISIDSDFGVPVNSKGQVVQNYQVEKSQKSKSESLLDESDEYDTFEDDEYDDDDDSNESEFTDLDNDSMMTSSLMLNTFDEGDDNSYSFVRTSNTSEFNSRKSRKKKKNDSFDHFGLPKNSLRLSPSSNSKSYNNLTALTKKEPELAFEKITPSTVDDKVKKNSNLSSLIHTKYKSSTNNPLNYFLFVADEASAAHKVKIDVYLPPNRQPVLKQLSLNNHISVSDCIGYILLNLCKLPEFNKKTDFTSLNPNCWKLELVDEDGENYGAFGLLDRTRTISSYNNPKQLAICTVDDLKEISKNEAQTPLPVEFKQNLSDFQRKRNSIDQIVIQGDLLSTHKIELTIILFEYDSGIPQKSTIKVPNNYRMGQVLKEFCGEKNLITTKYRFKLNSPTIGKSRFVRDVEFCSDLESTTLELIPSETKVNSMIDEIQIGQANITPSEFTLPNITPNVGQLEEKTQKFSLQNMAPMRPPTSKASSSSLLLKPETARKPSANSAKSIKKAILEKSSNDVSNKYLDDILLGNNPQLPTNINSIYFKWRVFKNNSKIKIKTFSERNFIIDGDYIHLTPPDDLTLRNSSLNDLMLEPNLAAGGHHLSHQFNKNYHKHSAKTYSFHITQIMNLKQYTKTPNYFRIIIQKQHDSNIINGSNNKTDISKEMLKKFYLLAINENECSEIIDKLKWVLQVYNFSGVL